MREPAEGGWRVWAAPLFPLVAVALGGGTTRWSQGVLLVLLGVMLTAAPPRASAGRGMHAVLGGLLLLALAAFLPAAWFHAAPWRTGLEEDLAVPLAWTHTPQPWITAENFVLFLAGAAWFYQAWTSPWSGRDARKATQIFAAGAAGLATLFVGLHAAGVVVPIWPTERHFGPFPNRNQTADFLAVSSLAMLGCGRLQWRANRKILALAWAAGWLVTVYAVFLSYSRAGVAILLLGTVAYLALELRRSFHRHPQGPGRQTLLRYGAMAATAALALCSASLLLGGDTLDRFRPGIAVSEPGSTLTTDFRLRIQRDAVSLADSAPFTGVGLGNFGSVFPFYRERSALPARAIHPESDYLWLAGELGWGAIALTLLGCALIARRLWPTRSEPERALRAAAALAFAAFALHGLVDVSAHRLGTVFSATFLMGVALRPPPPTPRREWPGRVGRALGGVFIAVGLVWVAAGTHAFPPWPGLQGVERLKAEAAAAAARRDYADATRMVDQALEWAPLNWTLYFARASADLGLGRDPEEVANDFRRARYLEPYLAEAPMTEARLWAISGQYGLAVNALAEACRREPANAEGYVGVLFAAAQPPGAPAFHDEMATLARANPAVELPFYEQIEPPESIARIADAVAADPEMKRFTNDAQRTRFFRIWAQRGDIKALAAEMARRTDWQRLGWRWWAEARARADAPQEACEIAERFASPPKLPPAPAEKRRVDDLIGQAAGSPGNPALALQLYYARDEAPGGAALAAARRITGKPGSPRYFHWIDAELSGQAGEWTHAWEEWQKYLAEG